MPLCDQKSLSGDNKIIALSSTPSHALPIDSVLLDEEIKKKPTKMKALSHLCEKVRWIIKHVLPWFLISILQQQSNFDLVS